MSDRLLSRLSSKLRPDCARQARRRRSERSRCRYHTADLLRFFRPRHIVVRAIASTLAPGCARRDLFRRRGLRGGAASDAQTWLVASFFPTSDRDKPSRHQQDRLAARVDAVGCEKRRRLLQLFVGLVYAQDVFTAFQKGGLENPAVGRRYRQTILEPARTTNLTPKCATFWAGQ